MNIDEMPQFVDDSEDEWGEPFCDAPKHNPSEVGLYCSRMAQCQDDVRIRNEGKYTGGFIYAVTITTKKPFITDLNTFREKVYKEFSYGFNAIMEFHKAYDAVHAHGLIELHKPLVFNKPKVMYFSSDKHITLTMKAITDRKGWIDYCIKNGTTTILRNFDLNKNI